MGNGGHAAPSGCVAGHRAPKHPGGPDGPRRGGAAGLDGRSRHGGPLAGRAANEGGKKAVDGGSPRGQEEPGRVAAATPLGGSAASIAGVPPERWPGFSSHPHGGALWRSCS
jgi:hypothetical protein